MARHDFSEGEIGWILLSREAVARAEQALNADEKGVRDEVGFLGIHQGFADRFFPGTSVLHTRLRYALFIPWQMERVAAEGHMDLARRLAASEASLAGQLKRGRQDDPEVAGIIGGKIWPRHAAQPPSFSYWSALAAWGILKRHTNGAVLSRIETLRRLVHLNPNPRNRITDDDGGVLSQDASVPFVRLPRPPASLGSRDEPLDFKLTDSERDFLRKHLLGVRRAHTTSPSLLAMLAEIPFALEVEHPWSDEIVALADNADKLALSVARKASALAGIGRAIYAALVEAIRSADGLPEAGKHASHLKTMVEAHRDDACALSFEDLTSLLPNLSQSLIGLLSETQRWIASGQTDLLALRSVYARVEQARKGARARLPDNVAGRQRRAEWTPELQPLAEPIGYRWRNVRRLMTDLHAT